MKTSSFLDGQMLIAMPGMGDPRFERSRHLLCAHSDNGAMGIIVNKRVADDFLHAICSTGSISCRRKRIKLPDDVQ